MFNDNELLDVTQLLLVLQHNTIVNHDNEYGKYSSTANENIHSGVAEQQFQQASKSLLFKGVKKMKRFSLLNFF